MAISTLSCVLAPPPLGYILSYLVRVAHALTQLVCLLLSYDSDYTHGSSWEEAVHILCALSAFARAHPQYSDMRTRTVDMPHSSDLPCNRQQTNDETEPNRWTDVHAVMVSVTTYCERVTVTRNLRSTAVSRARDWNSNNQRVVYRSVSSGNNHHDFMTLNIKNHIGIYRYYL